jgi:hypothetical protein
MLDVSNEENGNWEQTQTANVGRNKTNLVQEACCEGVTVLGEIAMKFCLFEIVVAANNN